MKIQYISDIYLNLHKNIRFEDLITPNAEYLILNGNIGECNSEIFVRFLKWCKERWKSVFFVAGNWEFRTGEGMTDTKKMIESICKENDIEFLDRKSIVINGIKIIGTTLWSYININDDLIVNSCYQYITDFRNIPMTIRERNEIFRQDVEFIYDEVKNSEGCPIVLITHYAPREECVNPNYTNSYVIFSFYTDLTYIIDELPEKSVWIYGHTHYNNDFHINGKRLLTNQYGYEQRSLSNYTNDKTIVIDENNENNEYDVRSFYKDYNFKEDYFE